MREHQSRWLFMSALFALLATVAGCTRHVHVSRERSWEYAPEHQVAVYPEAQTVRVIFVEAPRYQEEVSGRGLCNQLKVAGKGTVAIEYDTWSNSCPRHNSRKVTYSVPSTERLLNTKHFSRLPPKSVARQ